MRKLCYNGLKKSGNCNTEVDIIPKGYTCKLQPMDGGINKPVKNYINHQFDE
jgi:hypothetical protein